MRDIQENDIHLQEGYVADDLITRGFMNKTTCIEPTTLVEYGTYRVRITQVDSNLICTKYTNYYT